MNRRATTPTIPDTRITPDMSLTDLIYQYTGIAISRESLGSDLDSQLLVSSLLVLVAKSDGGISPDESMRMVTLLRNRFGANPAEALDLINRAGDELAHDAEIDAILSSAAQTLSLAQKEDLMLMVLQVISADNVKDAAEMKLMVTLMEKLDLSDRSMEKIYGRYFEV
jgi:uncharacterized tellurite resistance protein B-like protein